MPARYAPLEQYLSALPTSISQITLTFAQIEQILTVSLPASAYEDRRWWDKATEANHVTSRAWSNAGWQIGRLDVETHVVNFVRTTRKASMH